MRLLSSVVGAVVVAVAAVLLTLFALENTQIVSLSFLGAHFSGNIWWLVLGAAVIGFLLALVLVVPGRMTTSHRASNLSQLNAQHEHDLSDLRAAHEQLQAQRDQLTTEHARAGNELQTLRDELGVARSDRDAARQEREQLRSARDQMQSEMSQLRDERERLVAERDQLRERLAASPAVAPATADGYRASVEPALMGAATGAATGKMDDQRDTARQDQIVSSQTAEEPEMPAAQQAPAAAASEDQVVAREPAATEPTEPSLGDRLRAMVTGRSVDETQAEDNQRDEKQADIQSDEPEMPASQPVGAQPANGREMTDQTTPAPVNEPRNEAEMAAQSPAETVQPAATTVGEPHVAGANESPNATADEAQAQQEQPSLGERLRGLFTEPRHEETPALPANAEQPEQPTA